VAVTGMWARTYRATSFWDPRLQPFRQRPSVTQSTPSDWLLPPAVVEAEGSLLGSRRTLTSLQYVVLSHSVSFFFFGSLKTGAL
jgi:hypothetical protein